MPVTIEILIRYGLGFNLLKYMIWVTSIVYWLTLYEAMKSGFKVFMKYEALIYSKTVVYLEKLMPVKSIFFLLFLAEA